MKRAERQPQEYWKSTCCHVRPNTLSQKRKLKVRLQFRQAGRQVLVYGWFLTLWRVYQLTYLTAWSKRVPTAWVQPASMKNSWSEGSAAVEEAHDLRDREGHCRSRMQKSQRESPNC